MEKTVIGHGRAWAYDNLPKEAFECPECEINDCNFKGAIRGTDGRHQVFFECYMCNCHYEVMV